MKTITKLLIVLAMLSVSAFAQTTIVEYITHEVDMAANFTYAVMCMPGAPPTCGMPMHDVIRLDKFDTLEEAMQFMADHQEYTLRHFYSALTMLDVKVEEKKTSEPQPSIEKTEKIYKFGSLTKKKTKTDYLIRGGTATAQP